MDLILYMVFQVQTEVISISH